MLLGVLGTRMYGKEFVPLDAIQPVSNLPDKDIECFVIEGNKIWLGGYEDKQFKKINIVSGQISYRMSVVENPDWWISLDSIDCVKE